MDNLLPRILSFPPHPAPLVPLSDSQYDAGITSQIETLKKTSGRIFLQSTANGESPLDVSNVSSMINYQKLTHFHQIINPSLNTAPYIYILNAHITAAQKNEQVIDLNQLWDMASGFLHSFDGRQIRYLGEELLNVMAFVVQVASQSHDVRKLDFTWWKEILNVI